MNKIDAPPLRTIMETVPAAPGAMYTLFVLFLLNLLNYFDRIIPAVVLEPIRQEFQLNDMQLGMVTTAFAVVYAVLAVPMGHLVDSLSRKRILMVGVSVWSLCTAASGMVSGFVAFMVARMGVGVGEASCTPAATSMIGDLFPENKRAKAYGVFMLGLPIGTFVALALAGYIAEQYGWRMAFLAAAAPGIVVVLMLFGCKEPVRGRHDPVDAGPTVRPLKAVLSSVLFWSIGLVGFAMSMAAYAMTTYLPAFFSRTHGLSVSQAGVSAAIVLGAAGIVGLTAGGAVSDRVATGRANGRVLLGLVACLSATPLVYMGLTASEPQVATALLGVGWTLQFVYLVTAHTTLIDRFDSRLRGRAIGAFVFLSTVGAAGGSTLTGLLSDRYAAVAAVGGATAEIARSVGLQQSMALVVPGALLLAAIGYAAAAVTLRKTRGAI
jgi:MFS transporter, Spinster family, sphingosine-1-phosphate transporter